MSSGFSVIQAGGRYWLIQASPLTGDPDINAYPASTPSGPFDPAQGRLLYRDPTIGLHAADDYRIMYEARAEPALSTPDTLVISYNVNSEAVTAGCLPMSDFTNTVTLPRFITVPLAAFGAKPAARQLGEERTAGRSADRAAEPVAMVRRLGLSGHRLSSGARPDRQCKPRQAPGKVTLSWPDAGLGLRYRVYLQGPGEPGGTPVATAIRRQRHHHRAAARPLPGHRWCRSTSKSAPAPPPR